MMEAASVAIVSDPTPEPEPVETRDAADLARGEVVDESKQIDWHGLGLTLPPKMPASFMFDWMDAEITGDESGVFTIKAVREALGTEQWIKARDWANEHNLSVDDFSSLIQSALNAYGMGAGESEASGDSSENAGG